ncbi:MAG TPA: HAMP domain-containing sensor histidine kinase [Candidatus Paceibacterota bacterium]|jgi:signal transduction histidine kinase
MTIRALLALLITLSLALSFVITSHVGIWFDTFKPGTPLDSFHSFLEWLTGPLSIATTTSFLTGLVVALVFFIVVNALIVRPLRLIHRALAHFAASGQTTELPTFTLSPLEVRDLATSFSTFSTSVADSHARDAEMSRVKSDFISTAAHQLRTPLTGIRWSLEALEKEELNETQKVLVKNAVEKSHDLVGIVSTLLDISSIESGKYKYQMTQTDLGKLVQGIAQDFIPLASEAGVVLTMEVGAELPSVTIDCERIKWVLNNLIENAIHYTPSGGSVHVSTEAVANRAIVRIRDTGIGISPGDSNNIFERFYRAPNAITKKNQGNGLGLYIARSVVRDHQGELSFEANKEGPGTTFILALPVSH